MAIDPERVKTLFLRAIEREDPAGRRAFVDAEAGDNTEQRDRLAALLATYDQPPGPLDRPLGADPGGPVGLDTTRSASLPRSGTTPDDRLAANRTDDEAPNLIDAIIADRDKIRQASHRVASQDPGRRPSRDTGCSDDPR